MNNEQKKQFIERVEFLKSFGLTPIKAIETAQYEFKEEKQND